MLPMASLIHSKAHPLAWERSRIDFLTPFPVFVLLFVVLPLGLKEGNAKAFGDASNPPEA